MQFEQVNLDDVQVGERHRPLDEEAVKDLMRSLSEIGLKTPISVRFPSETDGTPILVAGRHRLEAMRRLGWTKTNALIIDGDARDARLWEIAENLHRCELTELERAEHIDEWRKLVMEKGCQVDTPSGGRQPHDKGLEKTAKELGVDKNAVRRAEKVAGLSDEAKEAAREAGLDDNQSALLAISRAADPVAEVERQRIQEEARKRPRPAKPAVPPPEPEPPIAAEAAEDSMEALEDAEDQQGAGAGAAPPAAPVALPSSAELVEAIRATAPQVAALVPDLLARARAAGEVWRENYPNLPDHEVLGVSQAEWKRRTAARKQACEKAGAEERLCLAKAIAELCRPIAAALLDISPYLTPDEEFTLALEDIVRPDGEEGGGKADETEGNALDEQEAAR